ncbi:hypothetical protein F4680DRAFT_83907 [Xylaria scruposa]|nr:hypothetical protein F4680DRAFT_83907 [Xylaria scruposa]
MSGHKAANPPSRTEFYGQGLQNAGSGHINVGRDVNIGTRGIDTLLKVRLTDPRDDKTRIEEQKGGLLYDSYKWILDHKDFQTWRDGKGNQLLWIRGDPGKGKTMLLCGIVNELHKMGRKDWNVAYYFCQATHDQLRKATSVLRGLIFLLLSQQGELLESVRERIEQASGDMFQDINAWVALRSIFARLVEEIERRQQTAFLIVDALDECLDDRYSLLKWVAGLSSSCVKILISSRNWPTIESGLDSAKQKVLLQLELNDNSIAAAVDRYVDFKVAELATSKDMDAKTREAVQLHLKSNSSNTFLWVALVCQGLDREDTYPWDVLDTLYRFPPGLDGLYQRMATQFLTLKEAEMCRQVLAVQALAYRPIHLTELLSLVDSPEKFPRLAKWLRKIVELCGSFLTMRDDTIYFVHQSAKDYLIDHMSESIFRPDRYAGHYSMAIKSIQALSQTLRENICQLPSLGSRINSIEARDLNPLNGVRYACVYWADHLENAKLMNKQDLEDGGIVHKFLENHLLHWLEALSLLSTLGSGIEALTKVLSLLQESGKDDKGLYKLVYDAMKFSRYHKIAIEDLPLQLYSSALIFSPICSVVRKLFLRKPEWLFNNLKIRNDWSLCLQTLEGHSRAVRTMAFSPNSRHLVSGSKDSTVRIWDVATGECSNVLQGHRNEVYSVAFSPNGELVVSSSFDGDIRIWNMKTGACDPDMEYRDERAAWGLRQKGLIKVIDIGEGQYHATPWQKKIIIGSREVYVALSSDGGCVAAAANCFDRKIQVWNVVTGNCIRTLDLSRSGPEPLTLALSPNNRFLAVVLGSTKMECEIATGQEVLFTGGARTQCEEPMSLLQFSSDSKLLVSTGNDGKLCVWEMTVARLQRRISSTLKSDNVNTQELKIKFQKLSPDGKLLGIMGLNRHFQIWDTINNRCLSTIVMKYLGNEVVFSPDNKYLACLWDEEPEYSLAYRTSGDAINVFNVATGCGLWQARTGYYQTFLFSNDGRRLVSSFKSRSRSAPNCDAIEVLNTAEGTCICTFSVNMGSNNRQIECLSLAPSHEGTKVAAICRDGSYYLIRIWDLAVRSCTYTTALLYDKTAGLDCLAFSPDERYIAYIEKTNTIKIFDITTRELLKSLKEFRTSWPTAGNIRWDSAGLLTDRGIYDTQALLNDTRYSIEYGCDEIPAGALSGIGISLKGDWILKDGECYFWIPLEYRENLKSIKEHVQILQWQPISTLQI